MYIYISFLFVICYSSLGQVLGKQVIEVKCNASPGRDAAKDEKKNRREQHSLATLAVSIVSSFTNSLDNHQTSLYEHYKVEILLRCTA